MAEPTVDRVDTPPQGLEPQPHGPLLRDPPPPPGYTNPVEESDLLERLGGLADES